MSDNHCKNNYFFVFNEKNLQNTTYHQAITHPNQHIINPFIFRNLFIESIYEHCVLVMISLPVQHLIAP